MHGISAHCLTAALSYAAEMKRGGAYRDLYKFFILL